MPNENTRWAVPFSVNITGATPSVDSFLEDPIQFNQVCDPESIFTVSPPDDLATTGSIPITTITTTSAIVGTPTIFNSILTTSISTSTSSWPLSMHYLSLSSETAVNDDMALTTASSGVIPVTSSMASPFLTMIPVSWFSNPVTTLITIVKVESGSR
jgi:hypothetical protein